VRILYFYFCNFDEPIGINRAAVKYGPEWAVCRAGLGGNVSCELGPNCNVPCVRV
jgi:hypothetical protein